MKSPNSALNEVKTNISNWFNERGELDSLSEWYKNMHVNNNFTTSFLFSSVYTNDIHENMLVCKVLKADFNQIEVSGAG